MENDGSGMKKKVLPSGVGDMIRVLEVGEHYCLEDEDVEFCVGDLIERTADGLWVNMGTRNRYTDEFVAAWGIVWEQVWITNLRSRDD